ncbi:MAG: outer membrane lipoprotein-sorting protein [Bacteroidota bacterium]
MKTLQLTFLIVVLILHSPSVRAQIKPLDLLTKLDNNFFAMDMEFNMQMQILRKEKVKRTYTMKVFRKGKKLRLTILEPSIERDRRILNDGDNLWMFLPRSSKLIKIPYKQAFLGGDASNRDILRISLVEDYDILGPVERTEKYLILRLKAKDLKTAYNQVNFYLDRQTELPVSQEMLSLSGKVIKTIRYDDFTDLGEVLFPTKLTILDALNKDSKTIFTYSEITKGTSKQAIFFTTALLSK